MAYRKSKGKLARRKKMQPAVMQLELQIPTGLSYIDLSLCASIVNRRGYKQENMNWAVSSFEFLGTASSSGTLAIAKLPETWIYSNAYQKSRALWHEMNDQVLDDEPGIQGKYHDFKIAMDANMVAQSVQCQATPGGRILTPRDTNGTLTTGDFTGAVMPRSDWNYSTIQIPNDPASGVTSEFSLHAVGPNQSVAAGDPVDSKGLIHGYAKARSRPQEQDPNVPLGEGWMNELFDVGENNEEIREDLVDDNDRPPYALIGAASQRESYPGGSEELPTAQIHGFCQFSSTTVSSKNSIQGGMFQNGLMVISNSTSGTINCLIHLLPGNNRGYLCEAMD